MKKLYLLRHAEADNPKGTDDHERPLNNRGKQECKALRTYILNNKLIPQLVLCSDSLRTIRTANNIFNDLEGITILAKKKLYNASAGEILKEISAVPDNLSRVAIVGHNPGIQQLAIIIARQGSNLLSDIKSEYQTCALTEFSFNISKWNHVEPGIGVLERFIKN